MPRDISELEGRLSRLKKEGRLLTEKQIEDINEMVYILPSKTKKEYKSSKVKKTKKQILLEEKEEKDKINRERLANEANEKQLLFMKKFHPEQYEALMNSKKEEPKEELKPEQKPKKLNLKKGNKAKMENEKAIQDRELELEKEYYKVLKAQDKIKNEKEKSKPVKKTLTDEEIKYKEIMNNPKIGDKGKRNLKIQTKNGTKLDMEILKGFETIELMMNEDWSDSEDERPKKKEKSIIKEKPKKLNLKKGNKDKMANEKTIKEKELEFEKEYKKALKTQDKLRIEKDIGEIMKGKSDLTKKGKKISIDTELNIKKGLHKKVKNALRKSIIDEIDRKLIGSGLYDSSSDESSSDVKLLINKIVKKIKI